MIMTMRNDFVIDVHGWRVGDLPYIMFYGMHVDAFDGPMKNEYLYTVVKLEQFGRLSRYTVTRHPEFYRLRIRTVQDDRSLREKLRRPVTATA